MAHDLTTASVTMPISHDAYESIYSYVDDLIFTEEEAVIHMVCSVDDSNVELEELRKRLKIVASRWAPIEVKMTKFRVITNEDDTVAVVADLKNPELVDLKNEIIEVLVDLNLDPLMEDPLEFVLPLSRGEGNVDADGLYGLEFAVDEINFNLDGEIYDFRLGGLRGDSFYVTNSAESCDGYAVVDSDTEKVVKCFDSELDANDYMEELENEEAKRQSEILVNLSTEDQDVIDPRVATVVDNNDGTFTFTDRDGKDTTIDTNGIAIKTGVEGMIFTDNKVFNTSTLAVDHDRTDMSGSSNTFNDEIVAAGPAQQKQRISRQTDKRPFRGVAVMENIFTGDDRFIEYGAVTFREFPLPLMFTNETTEKHKGSKLAGVLTAGWRVQREDYALIMVEGVFDTSPVGMEAARLFGDGMIRGVSVDFDKVTGNIIEEPLSGRELKIFTGARIMGLSITPFPAMEEASIWLVEDDERADALVASGGEVYSPEARAYTPITLNEVNYVR